MSKDLEDKIAQDIQQNSVGSALAKLFRKTLYELGFTPIRFSKQLDLYINATNKKASSAKYIRRETRSHVLRKLTADEFTWKVFMTGMFQFLNVKKLKITIELTHVGGKESGHTITILNNEVRIDD